MRFPLLSKFLSIGLVLMLMAVALMRIGFLVDERRARQQEAVRSVAESHAGAQTLVGPWLQRSCTEEWESVSGVGDKLVKSAERREFQLLLTADKLDVGGQAKADVRQRGLFRVNAFAAALTLEAEWASLAALQPRRAHAGSRLQCGPAEIALALSDARGVRAARVQVGQTPLAVLPGTQHAKYGRGLHAVLPAGWSLPVEPAPAPAAATAAVTAADATPAPPWRARLTLDIAGTGQLALVPAAGATAWTLKSDWPHPSFGGRFLPASHTISGQGFDARWEVSSLATGAPAELLRSVPVCASALGSELYAGGEVGAGGSNCLDTLAVAFFDPVNPYVLSDRAIKYGLLFVVLTFVAVALVEVLSGRRVHPVQYTLVGLALCLFFLLLLSLSEHLAFERAYGAAAGACATLLAYYAAHMLGRWLAGAVFGAAIALLYGLLYLLLQMEQNALAVGSVGLFAALAGVMVATRRIDWYALFDGWRRGNPGVTT